MKKDIMILSLLAVLSAQAGLFDAFVKKDAELEAVRAKNAATPIVPVLKTSSVAPGEAPVSVPVVPAPQPAAVPAPAVQTPAVPAPATAAAETKSVPAATPSAANLPRTKATDTAVPAVNFGGVSLEKPATPEQIDQARKTFIDKKYSLDSVSVTVDGVDDETLACLLLAFPEVRSLTIWNMTLKSLDAVGACKGLVDLTIKEGELPDLAPLAGHAKLKYLRLPQTTIRSLAPLGVMPSLEKIVLDDATFDDFTPLAQCPRLAEVDFSGSTVPAEKQATIGKLKQVVRFYGTFGDLTSVAWAREIPQATTLHVGRGSIDDFTPLSALTNVEELHLWGLKERGGAKPIGSLAFLKACVKMQRLNLAQSDYSDFAVVGGLKELEELNLSGSVKPVDLSSLKNLAKLRVLDLSDCEVSNFDAIVGLPALADLKLDGAKGIKSLKPFATSKTLCNLTIGDGQFPKEEVDEVKKTLAAANPDFSLNVW